MVRIHPTGIVLTATAIVLLIPFTAMHFTDEVYWTGADFLVAGGLLFGTGLLGSLMIRKVKPFWYRIAACVGLLATLLLVWAELAVGLAENLLGG